MHPNLESAINLSHHYGRLYDARFDFRNYNLVNLVASLVQGKSVLDLGSGSGFLVDHLSKNGFNAIGIEPNTELIALAKRRNPGLDIRKGAAEEVNLLIREPIDTITAVDVLEHLEEEGRILDSMKGCLNVGGRLVIVVPAYPILFGERDRKYGHYRRYSKRSFIKFISKHGFTIKKIRYWNMLGLAPYFISEKILGTPLETDLRRQNTGGLKNTLQKLLNMWFKHIENKMNFGFGLSLICVAEKNDILTNL